MGLGDQKIIDAGDYVFGIFQFFMKKLTTNYKQLIDEYGHNIENYPAVAVELTKIVVDELSSKRK